MKRALTVALLSGLVVGVAPQVAFADHFGEKSAEHPAECGTPSERSTQHSEQTPPASSERSAPGPRYGDREQHDEDYF
jgi:hypothetical protein